MMKSLTLQYATKVRGRVSQVVGLVAVLVQGYVNAMVVLSGRYSYPCPCKVGANLVEASA